MQDQVMSPDTVNLLPQDPFIHGSKFNTSVAQCSSLSPPQPSKVDPEKRTAFQLAYSSAKSQCNRHNESDQVDTEKRQNYLRVNTIQKHEPTMSTGPYDGK